MKNLLYTFNLKNSLTLFILFFISLNLNAQTRSWTGTVNDDWKTNGNWTDNIVPDKNTDVVIESSCSYYPNVDEVEDSCKSITIKDGANLFLKTGGNITVVGNVTIGQGVSGSLNGESGTLNIVGNLILNNGSALTITGCNITCSGTSIDPGSTVTYLGTDLSIKNWNYGNLILSGTGMMQITGDAVTPTVCNNLTINNTGNSLEIPVGKALTVTGSVTNSAGLNGIILQSNSAGDGSLICNTSGINATVERYISGDCWHYIASPIDAAPASLFNTNNLLWWDASMEWTGTGDYNPWKTFGNTNLENGTGYAFYSAEDTIKYQGSMNVGDYTVTLYKSATGNADNQGWNLIGNPYTSVLDWDVLVSDGSVPSGVENAIYFFDDDGTGSQSNYRYYVPSTGGTYGVGTADATGKIPLGQAFFVKTNTDNLTINLNKLYRSHNAQVFYKNKTSEILKIKITGNNKSDEMIFRTVSEASLNYDEQYDAVKLSEGDETIPQIYSYTPDNRRIAINSVPEVSENDALKLGFKAVAGNYTLNVEDLTISSPELYLYDSYLDLYLDLNKEKNYVFKHSGGEVNDRFSIVFNKTTSNIENAIEDGLIVFPNPAKDFINIEFNENQFNNGKIQIISITGKICYQSDIKNRVTNINLKNFKSGIWFVKIQNDTNTVIRKFIIRK